MTNAAVGGARNVTFTADDHRGARQEGVIQATDDGFELVREFKPYPSEVFNAKAS